MSEIPRSVTAYTVFFDGKPLAPRESIEAAKGVKLTRMV